MRQILAYLFYFIAGSATPLQRRRLATNKNQENKGQIVLAFQVTAITVIFSLSLPLFQPLYFRGNPWTLIGLGLLCGVF